MSKRKETKKNGEMGSWDRLYAAFAGAFAAVIYFSHAGRDETDGTDGTQQVKEDQKEKDIQKKEENKRQIDEKLGELSIEEKVAQMFIITPDALTGVEGTWNPGKVTETAYHETPVGGLIMMGNNLISQEQVQTWNDAVTGFSKEAVGLVPFLSVEEEGGTVAPISGNPNFGIENVGNMSEIGATDDSKKAYEAGKTIGTYLKELGFNLDFAPMADVRLNSENITAQHRSFGSDPKLVSDMVSESVEGFHSQGIYTVTKHFPGDGCDEVDQHILTSVNSLSCEEWDATYGKIYGGLIEAGAQTVMVGHIAQPAYQKLYNPDFPDKLVPATLSPELLKGLLRKKLGFNGLIVTDSTCMVGFSCAMKREKAVPYAIEAGCDMFLFNKDLDEDYNYMLEGYKQGILSEQRLDEAITRILATKAALGLHKKAKNEIVPNEATLNILKNEEHVKWAKNSADKAVTLVKDTAGILPLSPRKTKKVMLEIMGDFPSNERVLESFRTKLSDEGFEVTVYEHENFETARFDVETFKKSYDLVIYIGNVENASNKVTNRLSWYTFWGNGNNVPWFVAERPVVFISLANPYHLVDVPMIKTYINGYSNSEYVIESVMDKLMGRSSFTGKSPVNPFCGKEYLKW